MEYIAQPPKNRVCEVFLDFDGTISTLRCGWEEVMEPLMIEMISGNAPADETLVNEVRSYIDESTGIQTIFQMKWLAETVKRYGQSKVMSPWTYKAEYNRRLMVNVSRRLEDLLSGSATPSEFMVNGSEAFLSALRERGIKLFVASGTDDSDVKKEIYALGLSGYFSRIAGAPEGVERCSKEAVMREFWRGIAGSELCVIGDGKVEIKLGRENGARTLGVASDEIAQCGVNNEKRIRLINAGADAIVGDFCDLDKILEFLGW